MCPFRTIWHCIKSLAFFAIQYYCVGESKSQKGKGRLPCGRWVTEAQCNVTHCWSHWSHQNQLFELWALHGCRHTFPHCPFCRCGHLEHEISGGNFIKDQATSTHWDSPGASVNSWDSGMANSSSLTFDHFATGAGENDFYPFPLSARWMGAKELKVSRWVLVLV